MADQNNKQSEVSGTSLELTPDTAVDIALALSQAEKLALAGDRATAIHKILAELAKTDRAAYKKAKGADKLKIKRELADRLMKAEVFKTDESNVADDVASKVLNLSDKNVAVLKEAAGAAPVATPVATAEVSAAPINEKPEAPALVTPETPKETSEQVKARAELNLKEIRYQKLESALSLTARTLDAVVNLDYVVAVMLAKPEILNVGKPMEASEWKKILGRKPGSSETKALNALLVAAAGTREIRETKKQEVEIIVNAKQKEEKYKDSPVVRTQKIGNDEFFVIKVERETTGEKVESITNKKYALEEYRAESIKVKMEIDRLQDEKDGAEAKRLMDTYIAASLPSEKKEGEKETEARPLTDADYSKYFTTLTTHMTKEVPTDFVLGTEISKISPEQQTVWFDLLTAKLANKTDKAALFNVLVLSQEEIKAKLSEGVEKMDWGFWKGLDYVPSHENARELSQLNLAARRSVECPEFLAYVKNTTEADAGLTAAAAEKTDELTDKAAELFGKLEIEGNPREVKFQLLVDTLYRDVVRWGIHKPTTMSWSQWEGPNRYDSKNIRDDEELGIMNDLRSKLFDHGTTDGKANDRVDAANLALLETYVSKNVLDTDRVAHGKNLSTVKDANERNEGSLNMEVREAIGMINVYGAEKVLRALGFGKSQAKEASRQAESGKLDLELVLQSLSTGELQERKGWKGEADLRKAGYLGEFRHSNDESVTTTEQLLNAIKNDFAETNFNHESSQLSLYLAAYESKENGGARAFDEKEYGRVGTEGKRSTIFTVETSEFDQARYEAGALKDGEADKKILEKISKLEAQIAEAKEEGKATKSLETKLADAQNARDAQVRERSINQCFSYLADANLDGTSDGSRETYYSESQVRELANKEDLKESQLGYAAFILAETGGFDFAKAAEKGLMKPVYLEDIDTPAKAVKVLRANPCLKPYILYGASLKSATKDAANEKSAEIASGKESLYEFVKGIQKPASIGTDPSIKEKADKEAARKDKAAREANERLLAELEKKVVAVEKGAENVETLFKTEQDYAAANKKTDKAVEKFEDSVEAYEAAALPLEDKFAVEIIDFDVRVEAAKARVKAVTDEIDAARKQIEKIQQEALLAAAAAKAAELFKTTAAPAAQETEEPGTTTALDSAKDALANINARKSAAERLKNDLKNVLESVFTGQLTVLKENARKSIEATDYDGSDVAVTVAGSKQRQHYELVVKEFAAAKAAIEKAIDDGAITKREAVSNQIVGFRDALEGSLVTKLKGGMTGVIDSRLSNAAADSITTFMTYDAYKAGAK